MSYETLQAGLIVLQLSFLAAAFVLALVAARGYRGTPWGRVLRPMPPVIALLAMGAGVSLLPSTPPHGGVYTTTLLGFALLGIVYATFEFVRLLRRRTGGLG